jgi:hypothetical protein
MRENRKKHTELTDEARKKANARSYVHVYVKRGNISKKPCFFCGATERIEAHHPDYDRPTEVVWLCKTCHHSLHLGHLMLSDVNLRPYA